MPSIPSLRQTISDTKGLAEQLRSILSDPRLVADRANLVRRKLPAIAKGLKYIIKKDKSEVLSIGTFLENNAKEHGDRPALLFEDRRYTHRELNEHANRYANFYLSHGIRKGDAVAIFMENRPELLFAVAGAVKLGAIAAVINTKQRSNVLVHSFGLCHARIFMIGEELHKPFDEVRSQVGNATKDNVVYLRDTGNGKPPKDYVDGDGEVAQASTSTPAELDQVTLGDPCFYVYTSGTTGLPKASIMSHFRWVKASAAFGLLSLDVKPTDIVYVALPLYHNNALTVTWSSVAAGAACMAITRKFSATKFWDEVRQYNANAFCYIGELCRYLMNQPEKADDADNPIEKILGNGLRPDIWKEFKQRFGIDQVYEFYAASEGNSAFVNALNIDCSVGLCPSKYAIVEYDAESAQPVRDARGHLVKVPRGGIGLLVVEVSEKYAFDGYTNKEESEKKLIRNAFKKDDVWFNSGDLLQDLGFRHAQFVDRLGDTFRWKSENVSTNEVAEVLNTYRQIDESTVFGVQIPGTEGRAGMAAIVAKVPAKEFDFKGLVQHLRQELPIYAWPHFLRFKKQLEVTATLKQKKVDLRKQGYDPKQVKDALYVMLPKSDEFVPMTQKIFDDIKSGKVPF